MFKKAYIKDCLSQNGRISTTKGYKAETMKLQNRFEPIADRESPNKKYETKSEKKVTGKTADKMPSADDPQEIIKDAENITRSDFFQLSLADDFRQVTKFYDSAHIQYHTFIKPLSDVMGSSPMDFEGSSKKWTD